MQEEKNNNSGSKVNYFKAGLTAFVVICCVIIFFFMIFKIDSINAFFKKMLGILQPVILGAVIAYLVNPAVNFINKYVLRFFRRITRGKELKKLSMGISIATAMLGFLLLLFAFFYLVIPEFAESVGSIIMSLPDQISAVSSYVTELLDDHKEIAEKITSVFASQQVWFQNLVTNNINAVASYLASGVINTVTFLKDCVVGIMVAIYILASKRIFKAQTKKIINALFPKKTVDLIFKTARKSNQIFGGFINGKLLDSLIIGILCFFGVTILGIPYPILVSVIVGVTDFIPVFGPYIGGFICGVLILLISPIKCLYFVLFVILLQTLDGNIIGPKILGESTGLSAFWVMFSIILGGGLFGILGMLLGVPTFAVIYYLISTYVNHLLRKKKLSTDTLSYISAENNSDVNFSDNGDNDEKIGTDKTELTADK